MRFMRKLVVLFTISMLASQCDNDSDRRRSNISLEQRCSELKSAVEANNLVKFAPLVSSLDVKDANVKRVLIDVIFLCTKYNNRVRILKYLLNKKVKPMRDKSEILDAHNSEGYTALICAAKACNTDIVGALLDAGASFFDDGKNSFKEAESSVLELLHDKLKNAVELNSVPIFKSSISSLDVESMNVKRVLANIMFLCTKHKKRKIIWNILLDKIKSMQDMSEILNVRAEREETALMRAVKRDNKGAVRALVDAGADISMANEKGITALMLAASSSSEVFDIIMEAINGMQDRDEAIKIVDAKGSSGNTALMYSVKHGNDHAVKVLIEAGADISIASRRGVTALILSTSSENDVFDIVLKAINSMQDRDEAVEIVNAKTSAGDSALTFAVESHEIDDVKALIGAGADISLESDGGERAKRLLESSK